MKTENSFNILRLTLAILVILSHSYEIKYSGRSHEPLTQLFGSISFGEFAVDCFFIVSGYLIASSWQGEQNISSYLSKRIRRIFPAFIVCNIICLFVFARLAQGSYGYLQSIQWTEYAIGLVTLSQPKINNIFNHDIYHALNPPLWSIQYEFACYIALLVLMIVFRKSHRQMAMVSFVVFCTLMLIGGYGLHILQNSNFIYLTKAYIRAPMFFLAGVILWQNNTRIDSIKPYLFVIFGCMTLLCLSHPITAEPGLALFGSLLIIKLGRSSVAKNITFTNKNDVSYGTYLYAFPISQLLFSTPFFQHALSNFFATTALTMTIGYISWKFIEKPLLAHRKTEKNATPIHGITTQL